MNTAEKYKEFKKESLNELQPLMVHHLMNQFEKYFGIVEVIQHNIPRYYGINLKDTLVNSIEYYNNKPESKASWFYTAELKKKQEEIERVAATAL